jgi:hypothetical protein
MFNNVSKPALITVTIFSWLLAAWALGYALNYPNWVL